MLGRLFTAEPHPLFMAADFPAGSDGEQIFHVSSMLPCSTVQDLPMHQIDTSAGPFSKDIEHSHPDLLTWHLLREKFLYWTCCIRRTLCTQCALLTHTHTQKCDSFALQH